MTPPPVALSIAGSDCSSGAGIQADLKTFQHFHVHGLTAVTCVVSETSKSVEAIHPVPLEVIDSQLSLLLKCFPVAAIKTGMLHSAEVIDLVAQRLAQHPAISIVVDPVMIASAGTSLLEAEAVASYQTKLFPLARLITPNLPEAETLLGHPISSLSDMEAAALELSSQYHTAVLLKGGHLDGDTCIDLLAERGALQRYSQTRIPIRESHGTGCTLSAAICASLSHQPALNDAIEHAKTYLSATLSQAYAFHAPDGQSMTCLNQGTCLPDAS